MGLTARDPERLAAAVDRGPCLCLRARVWRTGLSSALAHSIAVLASGCSCDRCVLPWMGPFRGRRRIRAQGWLPLGAGRVIGMRRRSRLCGAGRRRRLRIYIQVSMGRCLSTFVYGFLMEYLQVVTRWEVTYNPVRVQAVHESEEIHSCADSIKDVPTVRRRHDSIRQQPCK